MPADDAVGRYDTQQEIGQLQARRQVVTLREQCAKLGRVLQRRGIAPFGRLI